MTFNEALELSIVSQERIAREYKSKKFFHLDGEDIILYLSHYEKSDPCLTSVVKTKTVKTQTRQLTRNSIPRIKHNAVLCKTRFDITEIISNLAHNKNSPAYPAVTSTIFNPVSGNLCPVGVPFVDFLAHCDGNKNIQQIARELSKKYNAPQPEIEEDCIAFIKSFSREGYVIF